MVAVGDRFGRWTVERLHSAVAYERSTVKKWWCRCDCGVEREVNAESLRRQRSRSCGCLQREVAADGRRTHGLVACGSYHVWWGMHQRCYDEKHKAYQHYGAKGVRVCERWHDLPSFVADMGARPAGTTLDRIDATGNYEPDNCRWATAVQQIRHRSNTLMVAYQGETLAFAELLGRYGVVTTRRHEKCYKRAYARYKLGWDLDRILRAVAQEKGGTAYATPPLADQAAP